MSFHTHISIYGIEVSQNSAIGSCQDDSGDMPIGFLETVGNWIERSCDSEAQRIWGMFTYKDTYESELVNGKWQTSGSVYLGRSWDTIQDDETGLVFKQSTDRLLDLIVSTFKLKVEDRGHIEAEIPDSEEDFGYEDGPFEDEGFVDDSVDGKEIE